ncbi:TatD family hydrolase [Thermobrachium celere]|uniref:Putative deoxyribonuclease YcfH n=1 Tax=Thermobrachium celere DSM 8682 TaxID=941824 RepID=R7RMD3_9CLOT|nr:TatD family hydrolase [Thermobrachium celere]GFR34459.1 hydrolase TatD [Thermobrachium celere]CDF57194.1 Putative deoxyribonuclease YcfH [Thermobrachium celere DSM 8682]
MIFDTHAHYDDDAFDNDREEVIEKLKKANVGRVLNCGASIEGCFKTVELVQKYDFFFGAVGLHPHEAEKKNDLNIVGDLLLKDKIVAVGEIGLDYYYPHDREKQKRLFREQMDLAKQLNKPVVIHDRDAHEDTLKILKEFKGVSGVLHCFSGSVEFAKEVVKLGYYLGFTGVVTFKNAKKAVEVVQNIPLDYILVETDCPYMAPEPYRGKRNDSSYLVYVIDKIAQIKELDYKYVEEVTYNNGLRAFML